MCKEEWQKNRRTKFLKRVNKIKRELKGCDKCGWRVRPEICEFHHPYKRQNQFTIGKSNFNRTWMSIEKEIKRCVLLCPNCHREYHFKKRNKIK